MGTVSQHYYPGYFYDPYNNVMVRFDAGVPSQTGLEMRPHSYDWKPTRSDTLVLYDGRGPETATLNLNNTMLSNEQISAGGGLQDITVPFFERREADQGAGELWAWRLLVRLGRTDLGELAVHDWAYDNVWFVGGEARVRQVWFRGPDSATVDATQSLKGACHIEGRLRFVRGLPSTRDMTQPSQPTPPRLSDPPTASFDGQYRAVQGGTIVKLGRYCDLVGVSVDRPVTYNVIGRCWGVRIKGRGHTQTAIATQIDYRRGRRIRLRLHGWVRALEDNWGRPQPVAVTPQWNYQPYRRVIENRLHRLQVDLRDRKWSLVGNGNIWHDCRLTSFRSQAPDPFLTASFDLEFEQEWQEYEVL